MAYKCLEAEGDRLVQTKPTSITQLILITLTANTMMLLLTMLYVLLAVMSNDANAETEPESQWPIELPWQQSEDNEPPDIQLFELPTLKGESPDFHTAIPALQFQSTLPWWERLPFG